MSRWSYSHAFGSLKGKILVIFVAYAQTCISVCKHSTSSESKCADRLNQGTNKPLCEFLVQAKRAVEHWCWLKLPYRGAWACKLREVLLCRKSYLLWYEWNSWSTYSTLLNEENHLVNWGNNVTSWLLRFCSGVAEDYSVLLGHDAALVDNWALFQGSMMSSSSRTHWCIVISQKDRMLMAVVTQNWYLWIMLNLYGIRSWSCLNFLQFIFCVESYKCHSTVYNSECIPDTCVGHCAMICIAHLQFLLASLLPLRVHACSGFLQLL